MMTVTEALAELKLIDKKVEKKRDFLLSYAVRQNAMVDPLGDSGGSRKVLEAEQQSVKDLFARKVAIRSAIARANRETDVTVAGETRSVSDWLVWRREVAPLEQQFCKDLKGRIEQARAQATKQGLSVVPAEKDAEAPTDVVVNLSERKLAQRAEKLEEVLLLLDGQLSLKNATVTVDV